MRLLLDTHALIWWWIDSVRLVSSARRAVEDAEEIVVSAASIWEIATKKRLRKLDELDRGVAELLPYCSEQGFTLLPIFPSHALLAGSYSLAHGDPFDRMLAAQAQCEDLVVLTKDDDLRRFPCATRW